MTDVSELASTIRTLLTLLSLKYDHGDDGLIVGEGEVG